MIVQPGGGYTTAEGWTGLSRRINNQYSHPVCRTTTLKHSCNNQRFLGIYGFLMTVNSQRQEKQLMGFFSVGTVEVQMYRMSQSHNDDITNVNR